ncbi:hypothetical protein HED54_20595 [Ochrobactrum anthropi ATCC 49188]|nr:hypothetical protein [Brucella anthropi ATCC 49188]
MNVTGGYEIIGSGNLVKTGAGLLTIEGYTNNSAFTDSPAQYSGSTWIQQGTLALIGTPACDVPALFVSTVFSIFLRPPTVSMTLREFREAPAWPS